MYVFMCFMHTVVCLAFMFVYYLGVVVRTFVCMQSTVLHLIVFYLYFYLFQLKQKSEESNKTTMLPRIQQSKNDSEER